MNSKYLIRLFLVSGDQNDVLIQEHINLIETLLPWYRPELDVSPAQGQQIAKQFLCMWLQLAEVTCVAETDLTVPQSQILPHSVTAKQQGQKRTLLLATGRLHLISNPSSSFLVESLHLPEPWFSSSIEWDSHTCVKELHVSTESQHPVNSSY